MTTRKPKDETPAAPPAETSAETPAETPAETFQDAPLVDADGNPIDPQEGGVTPPDLDAPTTLPGPDAEERPTFDDKHAVTMADVAALNGIGIAPDQSDTRTVTSGEVFISAGMASDMEQQGWSLDPTTGRRVERDGKE